MSGSDSPVYSIAEIAEHSTMNDAWIALDGAVFDITDFLDDESNHPGGFTLLKEHLGTDISTVFRDDTVHPHTTQAFDMLEIYWIGQLATYL
ncbi:cytochrome b5-like heme/steroid binding domain-containing protein [Polychytrium aggregatum]|uniref:cytochrome b5-like heme/steroid binding domain-containing protein n=1 Tax=Polychytrium aggregatum TaxID=110093 RepID=UPI0022FE0E83|nr:cytochrome b5-like heme/steroid binding domain-containing protein [Polychytrium aggregatum]KAI9204757.1 cytochrome b5-like heme/steroid binding domain-containing protein [Polychytrium aggregatum]